LPDGFKTGLTADLWINNATQGGQLPHLPDASASVAGRQHHSSRTGKPHMLDTKDAKPLILKAYLAP
jgi:hypothetical protein